MTVTLDADPFATPADMAKPAKDSIITGGRYRLPNRDGSHKAGGWQRMTNLVSAFSDQKALHDWSTTTTLAGLAITPALVEELRALIARVGAEPADVKAHRADILDLAERAKDAAGGGRGRERGNRIHELVEADHRDIPYVATAEERVLIALHRKALTEANLRPVPGLQERIVLLERYGACGKFDDVLECLITGLFHIGDTKTQKRFWTFQEVEAQLAGYAHSDAIWSVEAGAWEDWPVEVDRTQGAVLWAPLVELEDGTTEIRTELKRIDLERGWDTLQIAYRNVCRRSEAKSARQAVSGAPWRPVSLVEVYGRRFASVATVTEGAALVAECKRRGVWGPELAQSARAAADRVRAGSELVTHRP